MRTFNLDNADDLDELFHAAGIDAEGIQGGRMVFGTDSFSPLARMNSASVGIRRMGRPRRLPTSAIES